MGSAIILSVITGLRVYLMFGFFVLLLQVKNVGSERIYDTCALFADLKPNANSFIGTLFGICMILRAPKPPRTAFIRTAVGRTPFEIRV